MAEIAKHRAKRIDNGETVVGYAVRRDAPHPCTETDNDHEKKGD